MAIIAQTEPGRNLTRAEHAPEFLLGPVLVLVAIGAVAAVAAASPVTGVFAFALSAAGLTVPWAVYRRQVAAACRQELRARDGLACPACFYDLSDLSGDLCPECGVSRICMPKPQPMTTIGHGIDLVDVTRIAASIERHGQRFLDRVFTPAEQAYAAGSRRCNEHLAARFAAKEAALKALGTGWRSGIAWTDVEVISQPSGAPALNITGRAAEIAAAGGITTWHISLTHTETQAMASVIACGTAHATRATEVAGEDG